MYLMGFPSPSLFPPKEPKKPRSPVRGFFICSKVLQFYDRSTLRDQSRRLSPVADMADTLQTKATVATASDPDPKRTCSGRDQLREFLSAAASYGFPRTGVGFLASITPAEPVNDV